MEYLILVINLINSLLKILDMVNFLYNSIINYKTVYRLTFKKVIFNVKMIEMIKWFLSTIDINGIGLFIAVIKMYFYHFVYNIGKKYFNILRDILCIKKSAIILKIILSKIIMT